MKIFRVNWWLYENEEKSEQRTTKIINILYLWKLTSLWEKKAAKKDFFYRGIFLLSETSFAWHKFHLGIIHVRHHALRMTIGRDLLPLHVRKFRKKLEFHAGAEMIHCSMGNNGNDFMHHVGSQRFPLKPKSFPSDLLYTSKTQFITIWMNFHSQLIFACSIFYPRFNAGPSNSRSEFIRFQLNQFFVIFN